MYHAVKKKLSSIEKSIAVGHSQIHLWSIGVVLLRSAAFDGASHSTRLLGRHDIDESLQAYFCAKDPVRDGQRTRAVRRKLEMSLSTFWRTG